MHYGRPLQNHGCSLLCVPQSNGSQSVTLDWLHWQHWEVCRNADSQAPLQTYLLNRKLAVEPHSGF